MRALLIGCTAFGLWACDDGAGPTPGADAGPPADAAVEAGPGDAAPDAALDAALDAAPDAAPPDAAPPDASPCAPPFAPTDRSDGALHPVGCGLARAGAAEAPPRGVVVSGDSLARASRTPRHAAADYVRLAGAGFDLVWLLVTWDGIEPTPGTYNGAYLGRICEQVAWAGEAGLDVVLAMHHDRYGAALGGHGAPAWATPEGLAPAPPGADATHPSVAAAWAAFHGAHVPAFEAAWGRLIATCAGAPIDGVAVQLGAPPDPAGDAARARIVDALEAAVGPVLVFDDRPGPGPDRVLTANAWGSGEAPGPTDPEWLRGRAAAARRAGLPLFLRGVAGPDPAALGDALRAAQAAGAGWAVWHDGFATDPYALRDDDGVPTPSFAVAAERIWPLEIAGRLGDFGPTIDGGFAANYQADGRAAGLSRFALAGRGPFTAALEPDGPFEWFSGYDPVTDVLTVFVDGAPGAVRLTLTPED